MTARAPDASVSRPGDPAAPKRKRTADVAVTDPLRAALEADGAAREAYNKGRWTRELGEAVTAADGALRAELAGRLRLVLASRCSCCGRPWSTRVIAAALGDVIPANYYQKARPVSHSAIARLVADSRRDGDRVDAWVARKVAEQLLTRPWASLEVLAPPVVAL